MRPAARRCLGLPSPIHGLITFKKEAHLYEKVLDSARRSFGPDSNDRLPEKRAEGRCSGRAHGSGRPGGRRCQTRGCRSASRCDASGSRNRSGGPGGSRKEVSRQVFSCLSDVTQPAFGPAFFCGAEQHDNVIQDFSLLTPSPALRNCSIPKALTGLPSLHILRPSL